jgi:hypothetical protein
MRRTLEPVPPGGHGEMLRQERAHAPAVIGLLDREGDLGLARFLRTGVLRNPDDSGVEYGDEARVSRPRLVADAMCRLLPGSLTSAVEAHPLVVV